MNFVIVSAVFPPEPVVTARTSFHIAADLFLQGHQVRVYAPFPSRPGGRLFNGYKRSLYRRESMGFSVVRCFSFLSSKSSMVSRFSENISFAITSSAAVLLGPRPDLIYMNSWAIFGSGLVEAVAWIRCIPVAMSIQDIYPESLRQQNQIDPRSLLFKVLRGLDRRIAHSAKALIVISDRFRHIYAADRGVPGDRIHVFQNWGEESVVDVDGRAGYALRRQYGIPDHILLAVYGGNIGAAAGVETAIRAFDYLENAENICMLIAGAGPRLQACQDLVEKKGLQSRVFFYTPWPKEHTGMVLGAADVLLLPTQGEQSSVSVPSKLISYMLSGRPVLAMVLEDSDTADLILRAKAGWVIPPEDPAGTARALEAMAAANREDLRGAGASGLKYALCHLTREANLPRMIQLLLQLAEPVPGIPASERRSNAPRNMLTETMNRAWKRLFDCTVAITVLVSFAPVLVLIALAIKLTSTGPALFLQERIGRYGRSFRIVKFRSMAQDVPYLRHADGSAFSSDVDPRVTRIGRFLRCTSLDELPQLWNVLRGEMSLIGPRPELSEGTRSYLAAHFRRLNVRPGMTGWAVVHGRNNVPVSIRRDLDTWYADHVGFMLDFIILGKTIAIVLRGRGINRGSDSRPVPTLSSECALEPDRCSTEN